MATQLKLHIPDTLCEISVNYKPKLKFAEMPSISSINDAVKYLREIWSDQIEYREEFVILCLNRANKLLGYSKISIGGTSGTVADSKVIFQIALKSNASSIILAHNHPSGNIKPSNADKDLTSKLRDAGKILDLPVLDHIILTADGHYSFADEGHI